MQALRTNNIRYCQYRIDIQFFRSIKKDLEKKCTGRFLNFVMWPCENRTESKIIGFSKTALEFDENQAAWSLHDTLLRENIKSAKIKIWKNGFFGKFCLTAHVKSTKIGKFWLPILKFFIIGSGRTLKTDFFRFFSANFNEQLSRNRKFSTTSDSSHGHMTKFENRPVHFWPKSFSIDWKKNVCQNLKWLARNACRKLWST